MQRLILAASLALCGALALYPSFVWGLARTFDGIDDRWLTSLSQSLFTIPMALALAAVVLTIHGLMLNRQFQDEAAEEFSELRERELAAIAAHPTGAGSAPVGVAGAAPAGASVSAGAAAPARESRMGQGRPAPSKTASYKRRAKSIARRQLRTKTRFIR